MIDKPNNENNTSNNDFSDDDMMPTHDMEDFDDVDMDHDKDNNAFNDTDGDFSFDDDLMEQDFEEEDTSFAPDGHSGRSVNWFNVILFGGLGIGIIALCIIFLPTFFGAGDAPQPSQTAQQQNSAPMQQAADPVSNRELAEEAVGNGLSDEISRSGGLLANPDMLADETNEQAVREATRNKDDEFFDDLNEQQTLENQNNTFEQAANNTPNSPAISEQEMLDIFSTANNDAENEGDINGFAALPTTSPQPLPQPSDSMPMEPMPAQTVDDDITREPLEALQQPQPAPQVTDNDFMAAVPETASPAYAPAASNNVDNSDLAAQVDQLANKLDSLSENMDSKANELEQKIESNSGTQPANIEELQNTIARLEQRLDALSRQQASEPVTKAEAQPVKEEQPAPSNETAPTKPQAPTSKPTETQNTPVAPSRPQAAPTPAPAPVVQQQPANWELRGASPGEAYLADTNSGSVRTVTVGENLRGIGRITSIAVENNQWVVRGTSGTVRQ